MKIDPFLTTHSAPCVQKHDYFNLDLNSDPTKKTVENKFEIDFCINEWKVAICLQIEKEIKSSICGNESNTRVGTAKHTLRQRSRTR